MGNFLEVGALVRHAEMPGWGVGQIQSIVGGRITVNFENEGKVVMLDASALELLSPDQY
jgi:transcription elongation factor GreA-like protein